LSLAVGFDRMYRALRPPLKWGRSATPSIVNAASRPTRRDA